MQAVKKKFRDTCRNNHLDEDFGFHYVSPRNGRRCHQGYTLDPVSTDDCAVWPGLSAGSSGPYSWPTTVIMTGKGAASAARGSGVVKEARTAYSVHFHLRV